MTSRSRGLQREDERLDALIHQALRQRVAGAEPPEGTWRHLTARVEAKGWRPQGGLRRGLRAELSALPQVVVWCLAVADRILPLLEVPVTHGNDQRTARNNMHWTWLNRHHVAVRLLC
jgi:hypothetical protein